MRFMFLVYLDEEVAARKSDDERAAMVTRCLAQPAEWKRRAVMETAAALQPTSVSTTVRVRGGRTFLTDGPFAETNAPLGGYSIVDCANEDQALQLAAQSIKICGNPAAAIEVRPIL
jgi:hypothetical protein